MNERIKELLKQSYVKEAYYPAGNDGHPEYRTYISQEKFAELIVRECAAMTRNLCPHGELAEKAVKEHFGVKE